MNIDREIVVNAEGAVVGRLASKVAKLLLNGYRVYVVNIEKAVITGRKKRVLEDFTKRLWIKSNVNPRRHGPFKPRSPEGIFRRVVRGMLPRRKPRGKEAFRRLRVYRGIPENLSGKEITVFEDTLYRENPYGYVTLYEIARYIGWIPVEERVRGG